MQNWRRSKNAAADDSRIDWGVIFVVFLLFLIGMYTLYLAASHDTAGTSSPIRILIKQGAWWGTGIVAALFVMRMDSEQLYRITVIAYGIGIFLMIAVLILYDRNMAALTGGKSWFVVGPISFQPSEVMKPALIMMLSKIIFDHNARYPAHSIPTDRTLLLRIAGVSVPVFVLTLLQHDFGTTLVFLAISIGMVIVSGVMASLLVPFIAAAAALGIAALIAVGSSFGRGLLTRLGFQTYQFARVDAWLNPANDTTDSGYQLWQSMKAIGSGRLVGNGPTALHVKVPVRESDMIFSVIGEISGFLGSVLVVALYFILIYLIIQRTFETHNQFYAYLSSGVIMMILFHVFENIGMSIGLLPLTGIPLPFISQGGSALIANMIGIGFVLSMRYHNRVSMFSEESGFQG